MDTDWRNVYLVEIGPKSLGDARQDFCKDKECNLGPELSFFFLFYFFFIFFLFLFCNNTTYKKKKYICTVHYLQKKKCIYTVHYLQKEKIYIYSTLLTKTTLLTKRKNIYIQYTTLLTLLTKIYSTLH